MELVLDEFGIFFFSTEGFGQGGNWTIITVGKS